MSKNFNKLIKDSGGVVVRKEGTEWKVALLYQNGAWVIPKGRVRIHESKRQAALREVKEEIGVPINKQKILTDLGSVSYFVSELKNSYSLQQKVVSVFLIQTTQKYIRPLNGEFIEKVEWVNIQDGLRRATFPEVKSSLLKAINFLDKLDRPQSSIETVVIAAGGRGERMGLKDFSKLMLFVDGKPFLGYLIDLLLSKNNNFKAIYVLTHHYAKSIKKFLELNYSEEMSRIKILFTGANTTAQQLYTVKNIPDQSFIYMDGNIICHKSLFSKLIRQHRKSDSLLTMAVSQDIRAPTHLMMKIGKNKRITNSFFLPPQSAKERKIYCSMGIFAVNRNIFNLFPDLLYFYDIDFVIDCLIKSKADFPIFPYVYEKEWYALHNQKDYKFITTKGKKFFKLLRKDWPGLSSSQ